MGHATTVGRARAAERRGQDRRTRAWLERANAANPSGCVRRFGYLFRLGLLGRAPLGTPRARGGRRGAPRPGSTRARPRRAPAAGTSRGVRNGVGRGGGAAPGHRCFVGRRVVHGPVDPAKLPSRRRRCRRLPARLSSRRGDHEPPSSKKKAANRLHLCSLRTPRALRALRAPNPLLKPPALLRTNSGLARTNE